MSRLRFLADHDLNGRIIAGLLRREPMVDFVRLRDVLPRDTPDPQVLEHAPSTDRVVISHDVNTMTAAARRRISAGEARRG
jgi:predicted nuclease of predicted toxin-antitoxin system